MIQLFIFFSGLILLAVSVCIFYKSVLLYEKTKHISILLLSISFFLFFINALFQVVRSPIIAKIMLQRTQDVYPNYVKYQAGISGAIATRCHETVDGFGPAEYMCPLSFGNYRYFLFVLSIIVFLFVLYLRIKKEATRERGRKRTKIAQMILAISTLFFVYLFYVWLRGMLYLPEASKTYSTTYYISFVYLLAIFLLSFLLYSLKKHVTYFYLILSFLMIADVLGFAISSIPVTAAFALLFPVNMPYPFVLRPAIVGIITLLIAYWYMYKGIVKLEEGKRA
jgi:hypothetical protein